MEKRIKLEQRGRPANQIKELTLDNCRSPNVAGLTEEFSALESLSLINVGLTTLKGFPKLPNLTKLELSDNRISNGLNHLQGSPKLTHLNLSGNKIKEFTDLEPLKNFKHLKVLDLFNNEVTNSDDFREKVFATISPSLKFLDGFDINDVEALSDEDANGNESDEDKDEFSINGIEINLKELEIYEKRLKEKRSNSNLTKNHSSIDNKNIDDEDDLDEYLKKLNLDQESKDQNLMMNNRDIIQEKRKIIHFPILMLTFTGILFILNYLNQEDWLGGGDEEQVDEEEDDESEDLDIPLSSVYKDDIGDDNSDWNEEDDDDDDDDDDEEEDDSNDESNAKAPADAASDDDGEVEAETPARGKKRKHDG